MRVCPFLCFCLLLACQNPFALRDPEPPVFSRSSWIPPLSPDKVLVNMQNAVAERDVQNYIRCLADPAYGPRVFVFEPDPETAADRPTVFLQWGIERERTVLQQAFALVPSDSSCSLLWTKVVKEIVAPDTAVFVRQYRLDIRHKPAPFPSRVEGQAEFRLATDRRGEWMVYRWTDNATAGSVSWSRLKAALGG